MNNKSSRNQSIDDLLPALPFCRIVRRITEREYDQRARRLEKARRARQVEKADGFQGQYFISLIAAMIVDESFYLAPPLKVWARRQADAGRIHSPASRV